MTQPTLFDKPAVNIPLANKINSFYDEDTRAKRLTQKEKIYIMLKNLGPATQREISEDTGIARHLIPDRLLLLQKEEKVKIISKVIDNITTAKIPTKKVIRVMQSIVIWQAGGHND